VDVAQVNQKNPEIIFGCWCGKKLDIAALKNRLGGNSVAVRRDQIYELEPEIFLQPGPALFLDGLPQLIKCYENWGRSSV